MESGTGKGKRLGCAPHCSSSLLLWQLVRVKLGFTLVLKDTVKKKKIKITTFQGLVVLILKFYLEQILKMGRMNSRFILMQNKH